MDIQETPFFDIVNLTAESYKIALHMEGMGRFKDKPSMLTPTADWEIVNPSNPSQDGFFLFHLMEVFRMKLVPLYLPSMELLKELQFMMEISQSFMT